MIDSFLQYLEKLSTLIPLPLFAFIGSFLEEIVAPIPSPLVMGSTGSIIQARQETVYYILSIAIVGSVGKTIASLILYYFSDKLEDFLVSRFGKNLKISHKDTEGIGKHFNHTKRDDVVLFFLRATPLFPSAPISIICGIIKLNLKTYIISTFTGTFVKNLIYIYTGIASLSYLEHFKSSYEVIENIGYVFLALLVILFIYRHKKGSVYLNNAVNKIKKLTNIPDQRKIK